MRKDIADQWIAALRSGKYQQGHGALRSGDKFCCLGVLCDILGTPITRVAPSGVYNYEGHNNYLPPQARNQAGMQTDNGRIPRKDALANLNDDGKSFAEIADFIEQHWQEL